MSSDVEKIFIIDTSVLIDIRRHYPFPDLWDKIKELFAIQRLISHEYVYDEVIPESGEIDGFTEMVSGFKSNFVSMTQRQINLVAEIIPKYPQLIDYNSKRNQADPYLVALAVELRESTNLFGGKEYIIVTNESKTKPMKIPAVCMEYGIRQLNTLEFFAENGWRIGIVE